MNSKLNVGRDNKGTNVERRSLFVRHPILLGLDNGAERIDHILLFKLRDAETLVGAVHSLNVLVGTEKLNRAVGRAVRLESLKHLLRIVEDHARGVKRKVLIRHDARVMPALSLVVVHDKHVVGEVLAESEVVPIGLRLLLGN